MHRLYVGESSWIGDGVFGYRTRDPGRQTGTMSQKGAFTARSIDRYPDAEELRPTWLALTGHPLLQSVRIRNHLLAEGIDEP